MKWWHQIDWSAVGAALCALITAFTSWVQRRQHNTLKREVTRTISGELQKIGTASSPAIPESEIPK